MKKRCLIRYTAAEKKYLEEHFSGGDLSAISIHLNRSIASINQKACTLGLKRVKNRIYKTGWKADEDTILKNLFPNTHNEIIAKQINKTVSALRNRAVKLGLKKSNRYWTWEQENYILDNYNIVPIAIMVQYLNRTGPAIVSKYYSLR
ncbi:hypothetical protein [Mucilaginibacter lappiensis]|uniref:Uncharacterized protein n=1 Tax=Mucilaginibacter lappiensis TaxID=354630 RepID=A0A841JS90_9SPHI|nr:hypothetical protein [Mucilaginibacter lappiensis]MBB6131648.1 hypothetical protein [Mucilaginibacter lappiensis]